MRKKSAKRKTCEEAEAVLYIIAHCIISRETKNNSEGCLCNGEDLCFLGAERNTCVRAHTCTQGSSRLFTFEPPYCPFYMCTIQSSRSLLERIHLLLLSFGGHKIRQMVNLELLQRPCRLNSSKHFLFS